jgi:glycopeptide antibiotics resistance protein
MAANKKDARTTRLVRLLFLVYMLLLLYFLFFSEEMGRLEAGSEYRYNLVLFREIRRFYRHREVVGFKWFFMNVFGNVIAFMPFGMLMPRLARRQNWFFITLMALELSFVVEVLQLVFRLGCFDVDDLFLNTLGGFLGYLVYYVLDGSKKKDAV